MHPRPTEYAPHFDRYVSLVNEDDVLGLLNTQAAAVHGALSGLSDDRAAIRYAPGKWTVREVLGHLVDTERVFGYRALSIARGETILAAVVRAGRLRRGRRPRSRTDRRARRSVRHAPSQSRAAVQASGRRSLAADRHREHHPTSTRALAYIMAGHVRHHANVFTERYGIPVRA